MWYEFVRACMWWLAASHTQSDVCSMNWNGTCAGGMYVCAVSLGFGLNGLWAGCAAGLVTCGFERRQLSAAHPSIAERARRVLGHLRCGASSQVRANLPMFLWQAPTILLCWSISFCMWEPCFVSSPLVYFLLNRSTNHQTRRQWYCVFNSCLVVSHVISIVNVGTCKFSGMPYIGKSI